VSSFLTSLVREDDLELAFTALKSLARCVFSEGVPIFFNQVFEPREKVKPS
jgi:hypothetical protein